MPRYMPLALAAAAALPTSATADWSVRTWDMDMERSRFTCVAACTGSELAYQTAIDAAIPRIEAIVEPELNEISAWLSGLGFRQAEFPRDPVPYFFEPDFRGFGANEVDGGSRTVAAWSRLKGMELGYRTFVNDLPPEGEAYGDATDISVTLAHEIYHAVQYAYRDYEGEPTWWDESMPEAVGYAWAAARAGGNLNLSATDAHEALHDPDDVYSRAAFFLALGRDVGGATQISYFTELEQRNPLDGQGGLNWIDSYIWETRTGGLAEYFPDFIRRYAQEASSFGPDAQERAASEALEPGVEMAPGETSFDDRLTLPTEEIAAEWTDAGTAFVGNWSDLPDEERVYIQTIEISQATEPQNAHLIVDSTRVDQHSRHLVALWAEPGQVDPAFNVRTVNIGPDLAAVTAQDIEVELTAQQLRMQMPDCMEPGATHVLTAEADDIEASDLIPFVARRLRPSGGSVASDLTFTAPSTPGVVTLDMEVETIDRGVTSAEMGQITIAEGGCSIRLQIGPMVATWTSQGEYTEFNDPSSGMALYASRSDIAAWEGSWLVLPPGVAQMIMGQMGGAMAIPGKGAMPGAGALPGSGLPPGLGASGGMVPPGLIPGGNPLAGMQAPTPAGPDPFMSQMPREMSERFSRDTQTQMAGGSLRTERATCPAWAPGRGCRSAVISIGGQATPITWNASGQPVEVAFPGTSGFRFSYGNFDLRRPPGW